MSAYVVEPKTVNRIITYLRDFYPKDLKEIGYDPDNNGQIVRLGRDMYNLNIEAVRQRYPNCRDSGMVLPGSYTKDGKLMPYIFRREIATKYQALKSFQCWLYQCAEGDVPERKLYQALRDLMHQVALDIISNEAQYAKAEWA